VLWNVVDLADVPVPQGKVVRVRDHGPHLLRGRVDDLGGPDHAHERPTVALAHPIHQTAVEGRIRSTATSAG
jgi:hypothetical protein